MKRNKWHVALIITSLVVAAGLVGGCASTASSQDDSPPAPTTSASDISTPSPTETEAANTTESPATDTAAPPNETIVGSDPVSGQSQEVDLSWQEFCLSSEYQVQIAKDPGFTIVVVDTGTSDTAVYYPAGGRARSPSALTPWGNLESGHTYYWRARARRAATGQYMLSPWSEVKSFTVGSGLPASASSYGLQPLYPNSGTNSFSVKSASFAWSPYKDTTKYIFVLAEDAAMTQIVAEAEVSTTAYDYDGQLEYGESYFWRVMALEPAPSDWSATFSFQTESAPPVPPAPPAPPQTPTWAWVVITIGLALLIAIIVAIFWMRRR